MWLSNDSATFKWIIPLLQRFESDAEADPGLANLLHVHVFLTSLPAASDPRNAMLHLALDSLFEEEGVDVVVGLRARTRPGRPNWAELLSQLSAANTSDTGGTAEVFCFGPNSLCSAVSQACESGPVRLPFHAEIY